MTALLNSKLIAFWLKNKGKMQGNNYQLDKEPLLDIPILNPSEVIQSNVSIIVNQILSGKKIGHDTSRLEHQVDIIMYHLYEFSFDDACLVDNGLSKEDFERFRIN